MLPDRVCVDSFTNHFHNPFMYYVDYQSAPNPFK